MSISEPTNLEELKAWLVSEFGYATDELNAKWSLVLAHKSRGVPEQSIINQVMFAAYAEKQMFDRLDAIQKKAGTKIPLANHTQEVLAESYLKHGWGPIPGFKTEWSEEHLKKMLGELRASDPDTADAIEENFAPENYTPTTPLAPREADANLLEDINGWIPDNAPPPQLKPSEGIDDYGVVREMVDHPSHYGGSDNPHGKCGRGSEENGPDDSDCPHRNTPEQIVCGMGGCGFCRADRGLLDPGLLTTDPHTKKISEWTDQDPDAMRRLCTDPHIQSAVLLALDEIISPPS